MPARDTRRSVIVACLKQHGPMSANEISDIVELPARVVQVTISNARYRLPEKVFRIASYRPVIGRRAPDEAIFSAKPGPDCQREPFNVVARAKAKRQRHRAKNLATIRARDRNRRAKAKGSRPVVVNMFAQLASCPGIRSLMSAVAANSSIRKEAA